MFHFSVGAEGHDTQVFWRNRTVIKMLTGE